MSGRYVVHARRFSGSLADPVRNDTESVDGDDHQWAMRTAEQLSLRGMSVWVYEDQAHGTAPSIDFTPRATVGVGHLHVLAEWRPGGKRLR